MAAPVRLFEGVSRVQRNARVWIEQRHVSGLVRVALADLLQSGLQDPPRGRSHVQRVLACLDVVEVLHHCR